MRALILLFFTVTVFAVDKNCGTDVVYASGTIPIPEAIARVPRDRKPEELARAGKLYDVAAPLPALADGRYLYLIGRLPNGDIRIGITLRVPDVTVAADQPFLATHASVEAQFPEGTTFLGAGQFLRRRGKNVELDNKAGHYPNGPTQLAFSRDILGVGGMSFPEAALRDFSRGVPDLEHAVPTALGRLQLCFNTHAPLREVRTTASRILDKLYAKFPDARRPGAIDPIAVFRALETHLEEKYGDRQISRVISQLGVFLKLADYEGVELALQQTFVRGRLVDIMAGPEEARTAHLDGIRTPLALIAKLIDELP